MSVHLDHLIVPVVDRDASLRFYTDVMGFRHDGDQGPFAVVRVSDSLTLQVAAWGTPGGMHFAFALSREDFDATFARIRAAGIPYGDAFHTVGNMKGPGDEPGARGPGKALYCFDPSKHLVEIRYYGE